MRNNFPKIYILKTGQTFFCPFYRLSRTINDVDVTMTVSYVVFRSWCKNLQICSFFRSGMLKSLNYKAFSLTWANIYASLLEQKKAFTPPPPPGGLFHNKNVWPPWSHVKTLFIYPLRTFVPPRKPYRRGDRSVTARLCFGQTYIILTEDLAAVLVRFPSQLRVHNLRVDFTSYLLFLRWTIMNRKHRNPTTKQPTAATPDMTAIIVMLRSSSLSLSAFLSLWAFLLPGMCSLECVTVIASAVAGCVLSDGLVVTELSVELPVILGVCGESFAETALVLFRLLYGALQKQWSGRKVITRKPIRLQAVSLQIYLRECTRTRSQVQSRAWSFACLTRFAWQTKKKERLLVV